ncbi:MAG: ChaN family lipoprotein, partial [Flavobacteriales bacterium]
MLVALGLVAWGMGHAQVRPAYALFNAKGKKISHKQFLRTVEDADVVLFGEQHNNPIAHWLELVVAQDLAAHGSLVMGAEMIEADNQTELDQYLRGGIDQAAFDTLARLWPNYATDYAALVDLAKEKG